MENVPVLRTVPAPTNDPPVHSLLAPDSVSVLPASTDTELPASTRFVADTSSATDRSATTYRVPSPTTLAPVLNDGLPLSSMPAPLAMS